MGRWAALPSPTLLIASSYPPPPPLQSETIQFDGIRLNLEERERERKELSCEVWAPGGASIGGPVDCVIKTVDQRKREKEEEKEKTKQVETNKIVRRSFRSSLTAPVDSCHNNLPTQSDVTVPLAH